MARDGEYLRQVADTIPDQEAREVRFEYLTQALADLGVPDDPYKHVTIEDLVSNELEQALAKAFKKACDMKPEAVPASVLRLWDYLSEPDEVTASDLVIVFGGPGLSRFEVALDLYRKRLAKKILFTGKTASYHTTSLEEARYFAQLAEEQGVPPEDVLVEPKSRNTPENAAFSVALLKETGFEPARVILVTLPYHMRRTALTFGAVADWTPETIRQPCESSRFTRDNFYQEEQGWQYVTHEFIKMYGARLMKHF
ncbi:MAG TPA: YdcF family protein [Patescibacteria group bacterium]